MASKAAIKKIRATPTKSPTTLPVLLRKPPLLFCGVSGAPVAEAGCVGVMVMVLTCPVTVITDVIGVGVQVVMKVVAGVVGTSTAAALVGVGVDEVDVEVVGVTDVEDVVLKDEAIDDEEMA